MRIPHEIADGLRFAWTRPTILLVFGVTIVTNAFAFAYSGLVAPLGQGEFHVSPALVGLLAAGEPLGALMGGALIAAGIVRMDRRLAFAGGAALFMVALIFMALSPFYWLAFALLVLGGFGTAGFGNMQSTLMLTEAPPEMRSRLMGVVTVCIGTGPARPARRRRAFRRARHPWRGDRDGGGGTGADRRDAGGLAQKAADTACGVTAAAN